MSHPPTAAARGLRHRMTEAERLLWRRLRAHQLRASKFRRQHPLGPSIVDFICARARLVLEVDGGQHATSGADAIRDAWLSANGYRVLSFWNHEVLTNLEGVLATIDRALGTAGNG